MTKVSIQLMLFIRAVYQNVGPHRYLRSAATAPVTACHAKGPAASCAGYCCYNLEVAY